MFLKILKLKKDNPGVLLMVEVGYKIKFFDDDAKVRTIPSFANPSPSTDRIRYSKGSFSRARHCLLPKSKLYGSHGSSP